jgi:hypothetical protein
MSGSDRADRDFSQRALDVVKEATRSHDDETDAKHPKAASEDRPADSVPAKKKLGAA